MKASADLKARVTDLYEEGASLATKFQKKPESINFPYDYQSWYSRALAVVRVLAPDRYDEFRAYYEIDPRRKTLGYGTYAIQDFMKGVAPSRLNHPEFDSNARTLILFFNQLTIFKAILDRIESSLGDLQEELLSEIRDAELAVAESLLKVSVRAAGAVAGVVVENCLQKLAERHGVKLKKKNPTIADLNEPLKEAAVYDLPTWRKITYLADIRNLCTHKKDSEPTKEQVKELIAGADWLLRNVF